MALRLLSRLASFALVAVVCAPGTAQTKGDKLDLVLKGELKAEDPKDKVTKQPSQVHKVKLKGGQLYVITMDAVDKGLDPYLRIEDSTGKELAKDDDGGGFPNARILFNAKKDDDYRVIATAFEGTGKYVLRVRAGLSSDDENLVDQVRKLNKIGAQLILNGKPDEGLKKMELALSLLQKRYPAAEFPDGHPELANQLYTLGAIHNTLGQTSKALPYYERTLAMSEKQFAAALFPDGHPLLARDLNNLALLLNSLGQPSKALPYMQRALATAERLYPPAGFPDGHANLAGILSNLGIVLRAHGETNKALQYYERALAMREKLHPVSRFPEGHPLLATSLNDVGSTFAYLGQASKALPYHERALAMSENLFPVSRFPEGHAQLARSLSSLGFAFDALGQPSKALPYCERALAITEKLYPAARFPDGHPHLYTSLNNLGEVLRNLQQPRKSLPYFERALAMAQKLYPSSQFPEGHPSLATSLNNLGFAFYGLGEPSKAMPYVKRALATWEKLYPATRFPDGHPELAMGLNNLAGLLDTLGQQSEGLLYHERALAMKEKLYPTRRYPDGHFDLAASLYNMGTCLDELGQASKALSKTEQAQAMIRRLLTQEILVVSEAEALDRAQFFHFTRDVALSMATRLPDEKPQRLYEPMWDSKAFITRILQRRHEATRVAMLKDGEVKKTWAKLQDVRRELGGLLITDSAKSKDRVELLRALTDKKEKLEAELAKALPELERAKELAKLGPQDLADNLPKDAVLLDFMRYQFYEKGKVQGSHYVVFLVAPGRKIERIPLDVAAPIDDAIRVWRKQIDSGKPGKAPEDLCMLWVKIAPRLPKETKTIYIAADGDLTRLPFAALPGKGKDTVLLEDYLICHVPHAPFVLEQLLYPPDFTKTSPAMLAIGNVRYDLNDEARPWPVLKATGPEITQIAKLDPKREVRVLTGGEATVAKALKQLPEVGYAHFATHGFFEEKALADERKRVDELLKHWEFRAEGTQRRGLGLRNPLSFTGLVLAGANVGQKAGKDGGILSSEAIVDLPLDGLRLAVLSACETGLGELTEGEGVQGLQRAFHLAGCPNVIASLWQVNDEATAALMTLFYRNLWEKKLDAAEALRQAQLTIYRNPTASLVAKKRGIDFRESDLPKVSATTTGPRSPTAHWAAFTFSGVQIKGK